jgi:putative integral membrane protein (TIGR02587 family)
VADSLREYGRGLAGGIIFSLPLLYTLEVWQAGATVSPERMLVALFSTFLLLLGYNRYAGMRADSGWREIAIDSVEELGLGLLLSALVLYLLGLVGNGEGFEETLRVVLIEGLNAAIGFSVGTAQLGGDAGNDESGLEGEADDGRGTSFLGQLALAICGAVLFAANIAPTDEIVVIAVGVSLARVLGLVVLSCSLGALVLYFSNFHGSGRWSRPEGLAGVVRGTVITYVAALASSAMILWVYGRFDGVGLGVVLSQIVVLSLGATLGASAGRLLLQ